MESRTMMDQTMKRKGKGITTRWLMLDKGIIMEKKRMNRILRWR
jgi:hypothetical protein